MSRSQSICAAASCRLITNRIAEASSNRRASRRFEKHSQRIANAIGGIAALPKDRPADSQVKKEKEKLCHYSHKKNCPASRSLNSWPKLQIKSGKGPMASLPGSNVKLQTRSRAILLIRRRRLQFHALIPQSWLPVPPPCCVRGVISIMSESRCLGDRSAHRD